MIVLYEVDWMTNGVFKLILVEALKEETTVISKHLGLY